MSKTEQLSGLRRLTDKQLSVKIGESQKNLIAKRQEKLLGKLKNTAELRNLRREIARMKTLLDEKVAAAVTENTNE